MSFRPGRAEVQDRVERDMDRVWETLCSSVDPSWLPLLERQWVPGKALFDSVWRLMVCCSFPISRTKGGSVGCNDPTLLRLFESSASGGGGGGGRRGTAAAGESEEGEDVGDEWEVDEGVEASSFLDEDAARRVDSRVAKERRDRITGYPAVEDWFRSMSLVALPNVRGVLSCLHPISSFPVVYRGMAMGQDDTAKWTRDGGGGGWSHSGEGRAEGWEPLREISTSFGLKLDDTLMRFHLWMTQQGLQEAFSHQDAGAPLQVPGQFTPERVLREGKEKYSQGYDFTMETMAKRWDMLCLPCIPMARSRQPQAFHSSTGYRWHDFFLEVVREVVSVPRPFPLLFIPCGRTMDASQETLPWEFVRDELEKVEPSPTVFYWHSECHPTASAHQDILGIHNQRLRELGEEPLFLWLTAE